MLVEESKLTSFRIIQLQLASQSLAVSIEPTNYSLQLIANSFLLKVVTNVYIESVDQLNPKSQLI